MPVEAPDGTAALNHPLCVYTSHSTVGLPRESMICLANTFVIAGGEDRLSCSAWMCETTHRHWHRNLARPSRSARVALLQHISVALYHERDRLIRLGLDTRVDDFLDLFRQVVFVDILLNAHG